ncbi:MAG: hypothetical protein HY000_41675 [Planctomycetes bacterium]|nr:hypothetical protein [Planctomycetota bacterium]
MFETLIVETGDDGWTTLHRAGCGSYSFELPRGFPVSLVPEILVAAGLATRQDDELRASSGASCREMGETVLAVLEYFVAPDEPTPQLRRIQSHLIDAIPDAEVAALPLVAIAWLDLAIRADLAEEAASQDPWRTDRLAIDVTPFRERRLSELLDRTARQDATVIGARLAPSARQRRSDRQFRIG